MRRLKRFVLIGALAVTASVTAATALATTPGSNGQIAFRRWLNDETSRSALYTINPDGTGVRRIVPRLKRAHDDQPDWSPDGRLLAFSRFPDNGPAWINVVNGDGTGLQRGDATLPPQAGAESRAARLRRRGQRLIHTRRPTPLVHTRDGTHPPVPAL